MCELHKKLFTNAKKYDRIKIWCVRNSSLGRTIFYIGSNENENALRSYVGKDNKIHYLSDKNAQISDELWQKVKKHYADQKVEVSRLELMLDEASAYYAEEILGTDTALDLLLGKKKTLKEKILSFFKGAIKKYSGDEVLSKEARKFYRSFKKMFDAFAEKNQSVEANNQLAEAKNQLAEVKDQIKEAKDQLAETGLARDKTDGRRYSYEGKASDGKSIYKSNFPKGTPKKAKSERILKYITNVWSKEPISLVISNGETSRTIKAKFDPTIDETQNTPTDASKIAGGNRHGNGTEKRVTLDLADDYYQIVQESKYNYSKEETGKDNPAHEGVKLWHYFVDDIYFIEQENSGLVPYRVTINVKEKDNGDFVYSFNAEKAEESSTQQTLHAAVNTRKGANGELFIDSIPDLSEKSNPSDENSSKKSENPNIRRSIDEDITESPTIGNVAKSRFDEPKLKMKEKIKVGFTSAKDKLYIETVDELYGVEKYLKKFGGRKDAEAFVQQVRASETIAQTMIGNVQYDVMSGDGTKLGEGISKIFKPYKMRGIENQFNDYLLHQRDMLSSAL